MGSTTGLNSTTKINFGGNTAARFQLNGNNFSTNNGIAQGNGNNIIENASATAATLTTTSTFGYSELIQDGTGGGALRLNVTGNDYLRLYNSNTYSGGTTVGSGSAIEINANTALGTGAVTLNGGALTVYGNNETIANAITVNGTGSALNAANGRNLIVNGNISGSGALSLSGGGNASLFLGGDNSGYTGNATVSGNSVRFGSATAGSASALWTVNNNLTFEGGSSNPQYIPNNSTISLGGLAGSSSGSVGNDGGNYGPPTTTLSLGGRNDTLDTYSGTISNSNTLNVVKVGTGTQVLAGSNQYTGTTTVNGGTLRVSSLSGNAAVAVNGGGTLGASGAAVTHRRPGERRQRQHGRHAGHDRPGRRQCHQHPDAEQRGRPHPGRHDQQLLQPDI